MLCIGFPPLPKRIPAGMDFLAGLVLHRDDRVGMDMPIGLLVGVDAEHELVVREAVVEERPSGIRESRYVGPSLGRDDDVHGVARGLRSQ